MKGLSVGLIFTQDTLVAMEALFEFTKVDPNRNVFNTIIQLEASALPEWKRVIRMTKANYTNMVSTYVSSLEQFLETTCYKVL